MKCRKKGCDTLSHCKQIKGAREILYMLKFYESDVQKKTVQCNKEIFEPDGNAIDEALESLQNFDSVPVHSYD